MTQLAGTPDSRARRRATTDFETNLVVSAAAGTGKTSLLVERVLNAVGSDRCRLNRMAAVTFTRKAAAEMRERLARGLQRLHTLARQEAGEPDEEALMREADRAYAWLRRDERIPPEVLARRALEALADLDRFSASTIHSFCAEILRMHPVAAGVDPGFREDEGAHFSEIFERRWQDFLERELGRDAPQADLWRQTLQLFSLEEIEHTARRLCEFSVPHPRRWPVAEASPAQVMAPILEPVVEGVERILSQASGLGERFEEYLGCLRSLAAAVLDGRWSAGEATPPGLPFDVLGRERAPSVGRKAEGIDRARVTAFARGAREKLRKLPSLSEAGGRAIRGLLGRFVEPFREAYLGAGWVSFEALLALTRDLLRDHPGVRAALRQRYQTYLIDEFQDTSPVQCEILFRLAAEEPVRAGQELGKLKLESGRLFIVGDPKQSIYRFRLADISAYDDATRKVLEDGGARLELTANFRSDPRLIEALNPLFEAEFEADCAGDDGLKGHFQPSYQAMAATQPQAGAEHPIEIWSTSPKPQSAESRRAAEARAVADWLMHNVGQGRPLKFRDVAVLFRAMTTAAVYLEALRRAAVPFVVEGGKEFFDRPEVRHLRALLRCLARPHDGAATLAVLRSPVGAVSDRDLLGHARLEGHWSLQAPLPAESPNPVRRAICRLRDLIEEIRDLPVEEQVRVAVERSGLELAEASHPDGAQALANLRRYALAVSDAACEQALSLEQALSVVDARSELGAAGVEESPLADETLDAVRVLTVHKAKGMEFEAVIVPDLCRMDSPPRGKPPIVLWARPPSEGLAVRLGDKINARRLVHDLVEARHENTEALRVFYVACTRARQRLILLGGVPARTQDASGRWPAALRRWSYSAAEPPQSGAQLQCGVFHRLRIVDELAQVSQEKEQAPDEAAVRGFREASRHALAAARQWDFTPSGLSEERWEVREEADAPGGRSRGRLGLATGRVIHDALERWDGRGDGEHCLSEALAREVAEGTVPESDLRKETEDLWHRVVASDLPELLRSDRVVERELPFLLGEEDGTVWRGSIDLVYRDGGGWVVADYKTNEPGAEPNEAARRYLPQLRVYARAVERAQGRTPRAEIIWIRTGGRTVFQKSDLERPLRAD